ncbi:hypothetical protein [Nocardia asteroides]|uniref:hypothetical protein n=1 Tax=Nocardia asteroides TaxID=1824 RepID=UPI001E4EB295|nr:hypothetical protein [Nocardia asteroides]UGT60064.1 hypothetical protein LTT61_23000 [Nocardia asteroides]
MVSPLHSVLAAAAFGPAPGAAGLPPARTPLDRWHRAVALGGAGRYAAARAELAALTRPGTGRVLRSLALSTTASLIRQSGRHAAAADPDGRAAALVAEFALHAGVTAPPPVRAAAPGAVTRFPAPADPARADPPPVDPGLADPWFGVPDAVDPWFGVPDAADPWFGVPDAVDAWCDALTGLAADALGSARPALAFRLLARVREPARTRPRAAVRLHWVTAETALSVGDPDTALEHAAAAVELGAQAPSTRHRVKSALLLAAATAASGDAAGAAALAEPVARDCAEHDLLPLRWATAMLRAGLGAAGAAAEAAECAALLRARGGDFSGPAGS